MSNGDPTHGAACSIVVPAKWRAGTFANAFRIIPDMGGEVLVDFCVYSQQENEAIVVARLRVHQSVLGQFRDRLTESLQELPLSQALVRGQLVN